MGAPESKWGWCRKLVTDVTSVPTKTQLWTIVARRPTSLRMARPDPALLDPARYPFSCRIEPRFGDLDINMHINNVAMAGILEDARLRFFREAGGPEHLAGLSTMVASIAIDYLGETHYPEAVTIHGAVERLGRTSQQIVQLVTQEGRPVVFARTVIVMVGPEGPAPLTQGYVESAGKWMLPESASA
ncbi:thioesterase family protein [Novosphingobium sp. TCA1]|uniref:acyl-CoA thioesterase n=1 Tax=Novosphingobium sp. TCA1 TaxID=2682474 RepID=UPI001306DCEA|nr:acyl-CoA thioesterase [Novosphingobium sp. TCA1]GFE75885.1 hypothetical protein NTCA1_35340 [Novosphingobium sp. TCA1]